jgi:uncharacterized lipoprotein YajG
MKKILQIAAAMAMVLGCASASEARAVRVVRRPVVVRPVIVRPVVVRPVFVPFFGR